MTRESVPGKSVREEAEQINENARKKKRSKPMERTALATNLLNLRASIEHILEPTSEKDDQATIKRLSEMFVSAPHLQQRHQEILQRMGTQQDRAIDLGEPEMQRDIRMWMDAMQTFLLERGATSRQIEEVRRASYVFFENAATAITTRSLGREVAKYRETHEDDFKHPSSKNESVNGLKKQLASRYPFDPEALSDVVDIFLAEMEDPITALKNAMHVIARIWKEYGSEHKTRTVAHAAISVLAQKLIENRLTGVDQRLVTNDKFQLSVLVEFLIANLARIGVNTYAEEQFDHLEQEIEDRIQRRLVESVFFRRSQFDPNESDEQLLDLVERGRNGVSYLMHELLKEAFPTVLTIVLSTASMTRANPLLTPVGLMTLPVLFQVEKEKQKRLARLADVKEEQQDEIRERMRAYREGLEQLKTSPDARTIVDSLLEMMADRKEVHSFTTEVRRTFWYDAPRMATYAMIGGIGSLLQSVGLVSGKEIMTTIRHTERLQRPIRKILEMVGGRISQSLRDIERMEAVLGREEDLDPPDGLLEQKRKPLDPDHQDIALKQISYSVKSRGQEVLRNLNLTIAQGEYVLIAGKSGSGKSTLLRTITGLVPPDKGEALIGGEPIQNVKKYGQDSLYAAMAYSNQKPILYPKMSVRDNLLIWMPTETRTDDELKDVLNKLGLERFASRLNQPLEYASGGEGVRIGLARMLLKRASILLLDEPTAGLDEESAEDTRTLLRDLHKKNPNLTIVCVTHDKDLMQEIRSSGDPQARVVTMEEISNTNAL